MKLIRYQSWDPFNLLPESYASFHSPAIDVQEDENGYSLKADLPGIRKEDLEITVTGNLLVLKGERREAAETKSKDWHRSERWVGTFERSLELPTEVNASAVKASFKDGVLEVSLPKSESAKPKQIKVDIN